MSEIGCGSVRTLDAGAKFMLGQLSKSLKVSSLSCPPILSLAVASAYGGSVETSVMLIDITLLLYVGPSGPQLLSPVNYGINEHIDQGGCPSQ